MEYTSFGGWPGGEPDNRPHNQEECEQVAGFLRQKGVGRWIHTGRYVALFDPPEECWQCSECGFQIDYDEPPDECPACGAKMCGAKMCGAKMDGQAQ